MIDKTKKDNNNLARDRRHHLRPTKNFLGILGRATRRLGIRREENLVQRALSRSRDNKHNLDQIRPEPAKS